MNISAVLAALFRFVRQVNQLIAHGRLHEEDARDAMSALHEVDEVLGILRHEGEPAELPPEIQQLVQERDEARKKTDFRRADEIRDRLSTEGYLIEDHAAGTRVKRKK
jgi:cysteinyl-tRNA synthetase